MAEMATYIGVEPRTIVANNAIARGLRCTMNAVTGTFDVEATTTVHGDFITLAAIEAGKPGPAASAYGGGKVPAVAAGAVAVGDPAYAAASGQFGNTGTVLLGKFTQPASGAGVLTEVELAN